MPDQPASIAGPALARSRLVRVVQGHVRSLAAFAAGIVGYVLLTSWVAEPTRSIISWDLAASLFVMLSAVLFATSRPADMPHQAEVAEEGQWTIFWFTILGVAFSFAAVFGEFAGIKDLSAATRAFHVGLVVFTLIVSWAVMQVTFAYRYAHAFYDLDAAGKIKGGLDFPGEDEPDYWDFLYFAVVLGMTFQVSDVQITSRGLRRFATGHGFLGFLFNTVVVALTVNLASGLL